MINGTTLTTLPSKFRIYNRDNKLIGTAFIDHDALGFNIVDPKNERISLARLRRVFIKDFVDPG